MPIYEYWCGECKAPFEKLRSMGSSDKDVACPRCGASVKKMLSLVASVGRGSEGQEGVSMGGGGCGCGGNCACGGHN